MDEEQEISTDIPTSYVQKCGNNSERTKRALHLFDETSANITCDNATDLIDHFVKLEKLLTQDIRIFWDITSLENYLRVKRIPRGLRVKKMPSFGFPDKDFELHWRKILDTCSNELMQLIVRYKVKEKKSLTTEIEILKKELHKFSDMDRFTHNDKILLQNIEQMEKGVVSKKQEKFFRDKSDYDRNQVYAWERLGVTRDFDRSRVTSHSTPRKMSMDNDQSFNQKPTTKSILKSPYSDRRSSFDTDSSDNMDRPSVSFSKQNTRDPRDSEDGYFKNTYLSSQKEDRSKSSLPNTPHAPSKNGKGAEGGRRAERTSGSDNKRKKYS